MEDPSARSHKHSDAFHRRTTQLALSTGRDEQELVPLQPGKKCQRHDGDQIFRAQEQMKYAIVDRAEAYSWQMRFSVHGQEQKQESGRRE